MKNLFSYYFFYILKLFQYILIVFLKIIPKIILQFRPLSKAELEIIAPILDSSSQNVTYYDPVKKENITIETYTGDWELINNNIMQNEPFSISFIARKKRV